MKDIATKERFIEMRASGISFDRISQELKVSKQTLINWSNGLKLEIQNLQSMHHEALLEKYQITSENRVAILSEQLKKVRTELAERSLKETPTKSLFDVMIKLCEMLKEEQKPVNLTCPIDDLDLSNLGVDHWSA